MPSPKITSVQYFDCGSCKNFMPLIYLWHKPQVRRFPSGVFLIKHSDGRYILFDTGYSRVLYKTGIKGWLYRTLNPTTIEPENEIATQLSVQGIDPNSITHVVLSHLHPDHIGGIASFPDSSFIISRSMHKILQQPKFTDLVFLQHIPAWFSSKAAVLDNKDFVSIEGIPFQVHDLFGDESILICQLPGHTAGHLGVLINKEILLAGDAAWGADLLPLTRYMSPAARSVQNDFSRYKDTVNAIEKLRDNGMSVYCSHDVITKKELLS